MSRQSIAVITNKNDGLKSSPLTLPPLRREEPSANLAQEVSIEQVQQAAQRGSKNFDALLTSYIRSNGIYGRVDYDQIASLIATSRANGTPAENRPAYFREKDAIVANRALTSVSNGGNTDLTDTQITTLVFFASSQDVINFDKIKDSIIQSRWKAFSNKIDKARDSASKSPPEMTDPREVQAILVEAGELSGRIKDLPDKARSQEREEYLRTESKSILNEAYQNGISQQLTAAIELDRVDGNKVPITRHLSKVRAWLQESGQSLTREQQQVFDQLQRRYPSSREGR